MNSRKFKEKELTGKRGAKVKIRVSGWFSPYDSKGKTNLGHVTKAVSGLYIVRTAAGVQYVGYSRSQLSKTLYRHFQKWDDPTQARVVFPRKGVKIRVVLGPLKRISQLERFLIKKLKPSKQIELYEGSEIEVSAPASVWNDEFEFPF